MQLIDCDQNQTRSAQKVAIALGNFDGLHRGHRELIQRSISYARDHALLSAVLLFKQHSREQIAGGGGSYLSSLEDKLELLEDMGLDLVYLKAFDAPFMQLDREDFLREVLLDRLGAARLICGRDYRFGYRAQGNLALLLEQQEELAYTVDVVDDINYRDRRISSSRIREAVRAGRVEEARDMLGRPYFLKGRVINGSHRGRKLGFPTANLRLTFPYLLPQNGVYLTRVEVAGTSYDAMTDIGNNPTFQDEGEVKIESNLFNFDREIYGEKMTIHFLRYERNDRKFSTKKELVDQLQRDRDLLLSWAEEERGGQAESLLHPQ